MEFILFHFKMIAFNSHVRSHSTEFDSLLNLIICHLSMPSVDISNCPTFLMFPINRQIIIQFEKHAKYLFYFQHRLSPSSNIEIVWLNDCLCRKIRNAIKIKTKKSPKTKTMCKPFPISELFAVLAFFIFSFFFIFFQTLSLSPGWLVRAMVYFTNFHFHT